MATGRPFRIVLDTNILLRGVINVRSAAGRVVDACDQRAVILLLSRPILAEYATVLGHPALAERYPELEPDRVDMVLRRLRFVSELHRTIRVKFDFPRDPKDAMFIEVAIAGDATHLVTADADLLSLRSGHGDAAKRFRQRAPAVKIVDSISFLDEYDR